MIYYNQSDKTTERSGVMYSDDIYEYGVTIADAYIEYKENQED